MRLQAYHQSLHRLEALGVVHHIVTVPNSLRKKLYALPCDTVFVISLFISFMSMSDDSLVFICGVPLFRWNKIDILIIDEKSVGVNGGNLNVNS